MCVNARDACVFACMYLYCIFICVYIYTHILCVCMYIGMYVCMHVCVLVCVFVCLFVCLFVCVCFCLFVRFRYTQSTCIYIYTFVSEYTHTYRTSEDILHGV